MHGKTLTVHHKIPYCSVLTFMAGACPGRHIAHAILENYSTLAAARHLLSFCSQAAPCMLAFLAAAHLWLSIFCPC